MFLAFLYVWLPYMILPIEAALERVPPLAARGLERPGRAARRRPSARMTLPLALPGVVAGSIFTFSLTLGDFIVPGTLGNSSLFIGQAVLAHQGTAGNIPLAAAFTVVPMAIMGVYLRWRAPAGGLRCALSGGGETRPWALAAGRRRPCCCSSTRPSP